MSDQYEPSYYEIALTGRQVLAGFVILLVCLVAAFFSGVWVGRGGPDAEPRKTQEQTQADAQESPELKELSFFEEEPMDHPRDLGEVARQPHPETTLRQDVEGSADAGRPATPPPAETAPATPPPEPTAKPAPEPSAGDSEAAAPTRPDRKVRDTDPTPSGSLTTGDVVIQVFSSSEEAKAREVLGRLETNGFRAFLSPVVDGGRTLYRVRVGPFEHRSEAEEVATRLRRALNLETWITQ